MHKEKTVPPDLREVVLVVSDSKNKHEWHHGLVCEHLRGKDGVARGVRMIVKNEIWERPIQLICPLEIRSTMTTGELNKRIDVVNKEVEVTRLKRHAKADAVKNVAALTENEELF